MAKPINEKYSYKDFIQQNLSELPASEFNNTCICGSAFFQDFPNSRIFPSGMTGVEFGGCGLDNVDLPSGNTILSANHEDNPTKKSTQNRKLQLQNDMEWWELDNNLNPIIPANLKIVEKNGGNIDPSQIPEKYYWEEEITKIDWDNTFGKDEIPDNSKFKVIPFIELSEDRMLTIFQPEGIPDIKAVITVYKVRGEAWLYIGQREGK